MIEFRYYILGAVSAQAGLMLTEWACDYLGIYSSRRFYPKMHEKLNLINDRYDMICFVMGRFICAFA